MPKKIRDSVVVITGASSGIGRATALACARRCATIVAAARREGLLEELVSECERLGGRALAVQTDVTDEAAVNELACRVAKSEEPGILRSALPGPRLNPTTPLV